MDQKTLRELVKNAPEKDDGTKKTLQDAKRYLKFAQQQAKKKGLDPNTNSFNAYVTAIVRNRLGYRDSKKTKTTKAFRTLVEKAPVNQDKNKDNISLRRARMMWEDAERKAQSKGLKPGSSEFYAYVMGIMRRRLGYVSNKNNSGSKQKQTATLNTLNTLNSLDSLPDSINTARKIVMENCFHKLNKYFKNNIKRY